MRASQSLMVSSRVSPLRDALPLTFCSAPLSVDWICSERTEASFEPPEYGCIVEVIPPRRTILLREATTSASKPERLEELSLSLSLALVRLGWAARDRVHTRALVNNSGRRRNQPAKRERENARGKKEERSEETLGQFSVFTFFARKKKRSRRTKKTACGCRARSRRAWDRAAPGSRCARSVRRPRTLHKVRSWRGGTKQRQEAKAKLPTASRRELPHAEKKKRADKALSSFHRDQPREAREDVVATREGFALLKKMERNSPQFEAPFLHHRRRHRHR